MPNWLWPDGFSHGFGFLARLGQVLHWLATIAAVPLAVVGIGAFLLAVYSAGLGHESATSFSVGLFCVILGTGIYAAGRIARYLFAGE